MKKNKFTMLKMLLWMLLGAIFGAGSMILMIKLNPDIMRENIDTFMAFIVKNIIFIQSATALIFVSTSIFHVLKANKLLKKINPLSDDDSLEESLDNILNSGLLINSIYIVLAFMLFGFSVDLRNEWLIGSIIVFLVSFILASWVEVKSIQIIQSKDPLKKGDPASLKFDKQWIDSCDEAERMVIFKAAYKNTVFFKYVIMGVFILVLFSKMLFETGNFSILIVTMIWLFQSMHYALTSIKLSKEKIS